MAHERQLIGADGERYAEQCVRRARYIILQRNYRCPAGELDLVALDGGTIVFIEVKTRTQDGCGSPLDAVDLRKQRQIRRAAQYYLSVHRPHDRNARFDVVGVWRERDSIRCQLVKNAFEIA